MNLLSLFIAPLQTVVLFFAPHAGTVKPSGFVHTGRATHSSVTLPSTAHQRASRLHTNYPHTVLPRAKASASAKPVHRVRVVRNIDASLPADRAGRMVVSGRFADVCAELDKLASMEMHAA